MLKPPFWDLSFWPEWRVGLGTYSTDRGTYLETWSRDLLNRSRDLLKRSPDLLNRSRDSLGTDRGTYLPRMASSKITDDPSTPRKYSRSNIRPPCIDERCRDALTESKNSQRPTPNANSQIEGAGHPTNPTMQHLGFGNSGFRPSLHCLRTYVYYFENTSGPCLELFLGNPF